MSTIITQDLRSEAKDHGRFRAHKSKWSKGARPTAGLPSYHHELHLNTPGSCNDCYRRPSRDNSRNYTTMKQTWHKKVTAHQNSMTKKAFRGGIGEAVDDAHEDLSDSSIDVDETTAAPELDKVMYSYDAPTGPSHGADILSYAITQAVQRFENSETDKIIKNEYDVVLDGEDESETHVADADDDFEFIDSSHF